MEAIDCNAVMRQLWDYLDGELSNERTLQLAAHLSVCQRCHPQLAFELAFLNVLAATRRGGVPSPMLRERVLAALHAEGLAPPHPG